MIYGGPALAGSPFRRPPERGRRTTRGNGRHVSRHEGIEWLAPAALGEALAQRAERGDEATVVAGGTFLGILMNQGFLTPSAMLSLGDVPELRGIEVVDGTLRLGAMVTHRELERDERVRAEWPALARTFALVASPRVRNQATVGGVLADADYASDPPAMLQALRATAVLRSTRAERSVPIEELILGFYETCIEPDELLVEVRVPAAPDRAVYRKFRSRSRRTGRASRSPPPAPPPACASWS